MTTDERPSTTFPAVSGLTETAKSDPGLALTRFLEGRLPKPSRDLVSEAMDNLEKAFGEETDESTKARIGASLSMLRGSKSPKGSTTANGSKPARGTRG